MAGDYLDEIHQDLAEFADRHPDLWDDDDQRAEWLDYAMERKGYQRATHWSVPEPAPDGGQGGGRRSMPRGGGQQRSGGQRGGQRQGQGQQQQQQGRRSYFR